MFGLFLALLLTPASVPVIRSGRVLPHPHALVVLVVLLAAGCAGPVVAPTSLATVPGCDLPAASRDQAAEFTRLREVQGHFEGGPWIPDVDTWMGPMHQAMIDLGSLLGGGLCAPAQVTDLLGLPDVIASPGDPLFDPVTRQAEFVKPPVESYTLLIYYWRGAHDFLYFTSDGQTIFGSGWWHAYE